MSLSLPYKAFTALMLTISAVEAGIVFLVLPLIHNQTVRSLAAPVLLPLLLAPFVWALIVRPLRSLATSEIDRNRVNEERNRRLFEHMLNGYAFCRMIYDQEGNPVDFLHLAVNQAFGRVLGLKDVVGRKMSEVVPDLATAHPELLEILGAVARGGEARSFELDLKLFDLWLSVSVHCPEPGHFVGIFEDITLRKRAEAETVKTKEEWEKTFDAIVDPLMILGLNHEVLQCNKAMKELLDRSSGETPQLICHRCIHHSDTVPVSCPHSRLLRDGQTHAEEIYLAGLGMHLLVVVSPLFDDDGNLKGSVHYARNITEQKKLERQLQQSQKMEAIGTLAGGVAHDFNNILTAIIGFGSLLERELPDLPGPRNLLGGILKAADRAASLTRSLLSFSRKSDLSLKTVELNKVILDAKALLRRLIRADIELFHNLGQLELNVKADAGQLGQVLMNLVANSQDAISGPGSVEIRSEAVTIDAAFIRQHGFGTPGSYALITYRDTGCGMDEITTQRIFEPFFTTKEIGKGTGLGLSIVYGIVKQHNGFITCSSEIGHGTTFSIYLPLVMEQAGSATPTRLPWATGSETILLAEDDEQIRDLLCQVLTQAGYRVLAAANGADAVAQFVLHEGAIDLLISDIVMPGINGAEAHRRMQSLRPDLKVIFMSGYNTIGAEGLIPRNGTMMYKPLQPQELLAEVRRILQLVPEEDRRAVAAAAA